MNLSSGCLHIILKVIIAYLTSAFIEEISAEHRHAEYLYEHLLQRYNKIALPVRRNGENVTVHFGAKFIRIIDVDEKNQMLTTNLWLELQWKDASLTWNPNRYGGITKVNIPSDDIWRPDIVLYNNAAGDPEITIFNSANIYYDGTVNWQPPAIYKSFCEINVLYFPFDQQNCFMKFGMWSYTGDYVDMWFLPGQNYTYFFDTITNNFAQRYPEGMDLAYYYESGSWDLMSITAERHEVIYGSCCGDKIYIDITFYMRLRRKPLFYAAMLLIPCVLISFLTIFVFYIPANSNSKVSFSMSIFVTLAFFLLLLIDLIPPTSLVIPLFGKYLLFTMFLVTFSCVISVMILNFHHRSGATHKLSDWMRTIFLGMAPKILRIEKPRYYRKFEDLLQSERKTKQMQLKLMSQDKKAECPSSPDLYKYREFSPCCEGRTETREQREMRLFTQLQLRIVTHIKYITSHFKEIEEVEEVSGDWTFLAMVVDRLFFFIFSIAFFVGTVAILSTAPSLYDTTRPEPIPAKMFPVIGDTFSDEL